eukprot:TRINITY_DN5859_c0_g2_i3.p1 TRINITY_DN5859_c0_g2~~TRINITY_DN5859_c0_g2_i3.p1  ORF type:complete len:170 (-),score=21.73 TRINITY_DN5859_c0_g2_i3:44-553(-)
MDVEFSILVHPVLGKYHNLLRWNPPEETRMLVHSNMDIASLKTKIGALFEIPPTHVFLSFGAVYLNNNSATLDDYHIKNGDHIHFVFSQSDADTEYSIFLNQLPSGERSPLTITILSTVMQVKGLIQQNYGIPIESQKIIFAGKELPNFKLLSDYGICRDATIHLVLRS